MNIEQAKEIIEQVGYQEFYRYFQEKTTLIEQQRKEIERLNMRLETSNDTCNYLRNTIDKAIFFIQNQELHKSKDTTGRITMKERELIDILLGSDK